MTLIIQSEIDEHRRKSMNIIPGALTAVGTVKIHSNFGGTKPAAAGTLVPGSGAVTVLSDGRTPGKTPASEEYLPIYPTIVGEIFDKNA
jgi:hypothetical protein